MDPVPELRRPVTFRGSRQHRRHSRRISNVFQIGGDCQCVWREVASVVAPYFPGNPVVGYQHGLDLDAALAAGQLSGLFGVDAGGVKADEDTVGIWDVQVPAHVAFFERAVGEAQAVQLVGPLL